MSDSELMDWLETDVIAMSCHPVGWEFLVEGADGEPTTGDAFLVKGQDLREVLVKVKAEQERQIAAAAEKGAQAHAG